MGAMMPETQSTTGTGRWLLTGASGRIGRMLMRHWQEAPPPADLVLQSRREGGGLLWDPLLQPLPATAGRFSCLIAFAGVTPAAGAALDANLALAEATLAAAHAAGIARVLLTSSSAVYGAPQGDAPFHESDALRPLNPYGAAKVAMEAACAPWRARGLEICILRIGNVTGADVLLLNGARATAAAPLRIDRFADGQGPRRSYVGPADLARVVESLAAAAGPLPPVLNIGAPQPVDMADLADAAGMPWIWTAAPLQAVQNITLDCRALDSLHPANRTASSPVEMVRQWTRLKDPT